MKIGNVFFLKSVLLMTVLLSALAQASTTIVILRHGEKPAAGLGQLTCRGLNRSLALAPVLLSRYGVPSAIYATNPTVEKIDSGVAYSYVRPLATIEPLAIRAGMPVNIQWGMTEIEPLAAQLLSKRDGTFIVSWEHHWGEALARSLLSSAGGKPESVPTWNDADFDSLYVVRLTYDGLGRPSVSFSHEQQGLDGLSMQCSNAAGDTSIHP